MAYTLEHRRKQLTRAARANRPVKITYHAKNPCPGIQGNERIIEIRRIQPSYAGDVLVKAWCWNCAKEETFRLDRISAHRTLTRPPVDTDKPVSGYLSIRRRKFPTAEDLARYAPRPSCDGLLAAARERIALATQHHEHDHSTSGPCRTRPINKDDRCPRCPDKRPVAKKNVPTENFEAAFQALTADLDTSAPVEVNA